MSYNWTANQLKVQEWLATPRYQRTPPTQELFANDIGINTATISRWKRIDGFLESVNAMARAAVGNSLPEIYGALAREAEKGSIQHIKTVLELVGEMEQAGTGEVTIQVVYESDSDVTPTAHEAD